MLIASWLWVGTLTHFLLSLLEHCLPWTCASLVKIQMIKARLTIKLIFRKQICLVKFNRLLCGTQKYSLNAHFKCLDIIIQKILWPQRLILVPPKDFDSFSLVELCMRNWAQRIPCYQQQVSRDKAGCQGQTLSLLAIKSNLLLITFVAHLLFYIIWLWYWDFKAKLIYKSMVNFSIWSLLVTKI